MFRGLVRSTTASGVGCCLTRLALRLLQFASLAASSECSGALVVFREGVENGTRGLSSVELRSGRATPHPHFQDICVCIVRGIFPFFAVGRLLWKTHAEPVWSSFDAFPRLLRVFHRCGKRNLSARKRRGSHRRVHYGGQRRSAAESR